MKNYTRTQYAIPRNLQNCEDPHTNPARSVMKSSKPWRTTQEPDRLFYKIFKPMTIYTRNRHVILQNFQTYEDKTQTRHAVLRNLQTYEDPYTKPPRYSTKSSNPWSSTQETGTLFYKIFKPMTIYIRIRHAILQNLQNHEDTHTNPARFSTKSSNLWKSSHEPGRLFYKIFKHMMIYTRTRHNILQNLQTYEDTHKSPASLLYKIFKHMMIYTRTQQIILRNQLHYIVEF